MVISFNMLVIKLINIIHFNVTIVDVQKINNTNIKQSYNVANYQYFILKRKLILRFMT